MNGVVVQGKDGPSVVGDPMKNLLIAALAVAALGASSSAFAQIAGPVGGAPKSSVGGNGGARVGLKERERINEEILAKLNLTPEQKAKIEAHRKAEMEQLLALRKAGKTTKGAGLSEETKEKMKALRKENKAFMKEILTKDQMKELARLRREAMKEEKGGTTVAPAKP